MSTDETTLYLDGERRAPHSDARLIVVDPATEERFGSVPEADDQDVDAAVGAARRAVEDPAWRDLSPDERADVLERVGDGLAARAEELGSLVSHENGMPVAQSIVLNAYAPAGIYRSFAAMVRALDLEELRAEGEQRALVRRVPVGVVGLITPWNYPQLLVAHKLAPALAMGCAAVVKPAPETPLDAFTLMEVLELAGVPPGVVNLVTGGPQTGRQLVAHPGVDKIAFTGSTAVGRQVAAICGQDLRRVSLELGGKSAAIVLEDADLGQFSAAAVETCVPNTGQTCFASTRVLAPRSHYDEVLDALVEAFRQAKTGDPFAEGTVFGPLVAKRQQDRVEGYLALGEQEGAKVVVGGAHSAAQARGFYVGPTIFRDVSNSMRIAREEIFGPVVSVIAFEDEADAVRIANDSEYGLGGSVFSRDSAHATEVARQVQTGTVGINGYRPLGTAPFGGRKASGIGRELGPEGLAQYYEYQSIYGVG